MTRSRRRSATKVRDGRVQRKNRTELSNHYSQLRQDRTVIDRQRPGDGFRHFLKIEEVKRFIGLLPDWDAISVGLDAIVLAEGEDGLMGWHWDGVVAICAWDRDPVVDWRQEFVRDHQQILDRLGVECEPMSDDPDWCWCHFNEASVKGFQLMHILLHELGHHRDRMTTRSQRRAARGEPFADQYSFRYADSLWDRYFNEFDW